MKKQPLILKLKLIEIMVFLYVTSLFNIYGEYRLVIELSCIGILGVAELKNRKVTSVLRKNYYLIWGLLFITICGLSVLWGEKTKASILGTRGVIECFVCGIVIFCYIKSYDHIIRLLRYMVVASLILFIRIILTVPYSAIISRQLPDSLNANSVGVRFAMSCLVLLWLFMHKFVRLRFFIGYYLVLVAGIFFSGSRKALFVFLGGIVLVLIFKSKDIFRLILYMLLSIGVVYMCYYIIMNNALLYEIIGGRIEGLTNAFIYGKAKGDASTRERILLIDTAITYWRSKPILGYGINSFGEVVQYSSYGRTNVYTHCNYVELLFGVGIIGTILYYSLYVWIITNGFRLRRNNIYIQLLLPVILILLVTDIGLVSYGDEFVQFLLMILSRILLVTQDITTTTLMEEV